MPYRRTASPDSRHPLRKSSIGGAIVYLSVGMVVFAAFCSLAVDWGRVVLTRTELQGAADAAARAAASNLGDNPTGWAVLTAGHNSANGQPVTLVPETDVELGQWDSDARSFTPNNTSYNAVRVTARRTSATGNAVELPFARVIGLSSRDVTAVAIASTTPENFSVVGLDSVLMTGNTSMSFWSKTGQKSYRFGNIASNGNITLSGNTYVYGDARPGIGKSVSDPSKVMGSIKPLTSVLAFPNGDGSAVAVSNNNAALPPYAWSGTDLNLGGHQSLALPEGSYYFRNVSVSPNCVINCSGPVKIYFWGTFDLKGTISTGASNPANLTLVGCPGPANQTPGSVNIGSSGNLYMTLYAPQSAVSLSGSGDIYGSVLGKSISMTGNSAIHYDVGLEGGSIVRLVQ